MLDLRRDKSYRRGLILGLTIAEVMILLIFLLLMALAAALAKRDEQLRALGGSGAAQLLETLQQAFPQAKTPDDFFKELTRSIEAREQVESELGLDAAKILQDAALGRAAREAAQAQGARDPEGFVRGALKKASAGKKGEWPPFFSLGEADGFFFNSGQATLRPEFAARLQSAVIPALCRNVADYGVNVVEVIGHTDEVPMPGQSNLDTRLLAASAGAFPIDSLRSADNAGLAIARAVAVVRELRAASCLAGVTVLPLSAGQTTIPVDRPADGSAAGDDQSRRRIEIRLRRSTERATDSQPAPVETSDAAVA